MKAIYYFIFCSIFFVSNLQANDSQIEIEEDTEVTTQSPANQTMTLGIYYNSTYQWYQGTFPCNTSSIASIQVDPGVTTVTNVNSLDVRIAKFFYDTHYKDKGKKPTVTITFQSGIVVTLVLNA